MMHIHEAYELFIDVQRSKEFIELYDEKLNILSECK